MNARCSTLLLGSLLALAPVVAGCAARPETTRGAVPAPTGAEATLGSTVPAAARGEPGPGATAGGSAATVDATGAARPTLTGFRAIPELPDIHFDFDRYDIRPDAARILDRSAAWLKEHPDYVVLIEGHADERGTNDYNLALGERRARASLNYLVSHGIARSRFTTISYGEERPLCREQTEACWAKNRRAHFAVRAR